MKAQYALLLKLKVPQGLAPGTPLPIRGKFDYLVCTKEICVPESANLALDLSVGAPGTPPARRAIFDGFRRLCRSRLEAKRASSGAMAGSGSRSPCLLR
jgi:DsbC/DsbD-like thiol-disulfide interchange protein